MKTRGITETIFLFIISILINYSSILSFAQECPVVIIETLPGDREEIQACECNGDIPSIVSSSETISSGGSITLHVDSGELACPPYTWSVEGEGWSLSATTTNSDLENVTLSLINTAGKICGTGGSGDYDVYGTVAVTDSCGVSDTIEIRYSGGNWGSETELTSIYCTGGLDAPCNCWPCVEYSPNCQTGMGTQQIVYNGAWKERYTIIDGGCRASAPGYPPCDISCLHWLKKSDCSYPVHYPSLHPSGGNAELGTCNPWYGNCNNPRDCVWGRCYISQWVCP